MVLAKLAGTKTQTRRIVKGTVEDVDMPEWWGARRLVHTPRCQRAFCESVDDYETACGGYDCAADGRTKRSPYGSPGDQLWGRETWAPHDDAAVRNKERDHIYYRADDLRRYDTDGRWHPSIFMPRWASRILDEVVSVRVERVQDIAEADARAEGVDALVHESWSVWDPACDATVSLSVEPTPADIARYGYEHVRHVGPKVISTAREAYERLWESINGPDSWALNPWVWVVETRPVK